MSWFNLSNGYSKKVIEKEEKKFTNKYGKNIQKINEYKDIDNDETEHIIESENIDSFYDDMVDSNEQEEQ